MENEPNDPDLKPFPKEGRPMVFMFQPTHYKVVSNEKLQKWEGVLAEKVGLKGYKRAGPEFRCYVEYKHGLTLFRPQ